MSNGSVNEDKLVSASNVLKALGYKRVQTVARSTGAVIIPAMWLRLNGYKVDGHYFVKIVSKDDGTLVLQPVNKSDVDAILEANNVQH